MDVWVGNDEWQISVFGDGRVLVCIGTPGGGDDFFLPVDVARALAGNYSTLLGLTK